MREEVAYLAPRFSSSPDVRWDCRMIPLIEKHLGHSNAWKTVHHSNCHHPHLRSLLQAVCQVPSSLPATVTCEMVEQRCDFEVSNIAVIIVKIS